MNRRSVSTNRTSDSLARTTSLPGSWSSGFAHRELDRIRQPLARGITRDIDHKHRGQPRKYNFAQTRIAGHIAAHEPRKFSSPAITGDFEAVAQILSEGL